MESINFCWDDVDEDVGDGFGKGIVVFVTLLLFGIFANLLLFCVVDDDDVVDDVEVIGIDIKGLLVCCVLAVVGVCCCELMGAVVVVVVGGAYNKQIN